MKSEQISKLKAHLKSLSNFMNKIDELLSFAVDDPKRDAYTTYQKLGSCFEIKSTSISLIDKSKAQETSKELVYICISLLCGCPSRFYEACFSLFDFYRKKDIVDNKSSEDTFVLSNLIRLLHATKELIELNDTEALNPYSTINVQNQTPEEMSLTKKIALLGISCM